MITKIDNASVGYPITRNGVSFFPVYIQQHSPLITTGRSGGVHITERGDAEVPTLHVNNPTDSPVLLVEGETVNGGYQNRVLNVSVLVPAASSIDVPVSCVEQGRWGGGSEFSRGQTFAPRRVRRQKTSSVSASMRTNGSRRSDQGSVWRSVQHELARLGVDNDTVALDGVSNVFGRGDRLGLDIEKLVQMGPLAGQCGVVVSHGSRIVAADVFGTPDMFACHWAAVVRSNMLDATEAGRTQPSATRALRFLHTFANAATEVAPGVGLGREHHVTTPRIVGQALIWDDILVHASAFALAA